MAQVFVSYAHKNDKFVAVLKQKLLEAGFEPMIDTDYLRPGEDWRQEIDASIRGSFALITVMTPDAFESKYVTYEWAFALGLGIKVIPLLLEKTELHPRLNALQYISFEDHFNLDQAWEKLFIRLNQITTEQESSLKTKSDNDVPDYIRQGIDVLTNSRYFNINVQEEPNPLHLAINNLAPSQNPVARLALLNALEHPNPDVRRVTALVLGKMRREEAVYYLIQRVRDHDLEVQRAAIYALIQVGDDQCEAGLIDALGDADHQVRVPAAEGLRNFKSTLTVSALLNALEDRVGTVRAVAAESLGIIGDERSVPRLSKHLNDDAKSVQENSAKALTSIGTSKALAAVEEWRRKQQT